MREKNNWLKSIIVFGSVLLVILGMMPRGTGAEYVVSTNIWNQGQALFLEEFGLLTELTLEESDEEEFDETDENDSEEVEEAEPESEEVVEPEKEEELEPEPESEPEPQLPPYTVTEMTAVMYAQTNCNVRSGPSTDYDVIGGLTLNQLTNIVGVADTGWYKIDYSGMDAFVSNTLLAETQVVIPEPEPEPAPTPEAPADTQPRQRWEYSEAELIQIALAEAGVHSGMSAWDKAVAINNYLCGLVTYDYTYTYRSTFDTLAYGTAVCQGYANAFKKMMEAAGVPTDYVSGQGWTGSEWGSHGWNRVLIDGTYYYVDVTWNDCLGRNDYLMIGYEQMSYDHYEQRINPYRVE